MRYGRAHGLQRYRCNDCGCICSAVTETPLTGLRMKERFAKNTDCMSKRLTVRETAAECGVSISTAIRWRHRSLKAVVPQQPVGVEGILEVDESYFLHSLKGQRKLVTPTEPNLLRGRL